MNVKTFEELKLSGNLPSPAGVGMRILQLTRTEDYSAEEMGEAIMADPSLTGRILKLANSAQNAGAEPVTTVAEAIMRLGSRTVRDVALAFSLVSDRRTGACRSFDYEKYWSRSLARAVSAQVASRVIALGSPEGAFVCGLLGEIGKLALASVYADKYAELLTSEGAEDLSRMLARQEEEFNINHAQVGGLLLSEWGLPALFSEAVEGFCSSWALAPEEEGIENLTMLLRFADVVSGLCVADERTSAREWVRLGDGLTLLQKHLGMELDAFTRFCETCVNEWMAWGESLDVSTGNDVRLPSLLGRIEDARKAVEAGYDDAQAGPEAKGEATAVEFTGESEERYRILAVDDDPVSLKVLVKHLEQDGFDVEVARGGKEGLRVALSTAPDIVIADWEMPDFDGLELCRALRRTDAGASMFFLVLTGRTEDQSLIEAFDVGADDFVTKPFVPRILSARIKGGVRLARMQRRIEHDRQTMMKQVAELGVLTRKLRAASLTDSLTELPNRRYALKRLESEWSSVQRTKRNLSIIMVDIDHFKHVNDNYGHDVGDIVLREVAQAIQATVRSSDEACRLGGEEFLIICKNTSEDECMVAAERLRAAIESHVIEEPSFNKNITVSLGVASSEGGYETVNELFKASDEAVYLAKDSGRNQSRRASELVARKKSA